MRTLMIRRHVLGVLAVAASFIPSFLAQGSVASAAEVRVVSTPAFRAVMNELAPQFERATGHKLVIQYGLLQALRQKIDASEAIDVILFASTGIDDLIKQGKIAAESRAMVARYGLGVAVRAGALKPGLSSIDAFKRALLQAGSVAYASEGIGGIYFIGLLERLGIATEMKPKLRPMDAGGSSRALASGEVEIAVIPIPNIIATPGIEMVGPLPPELQTYIEVSAVVRRGAKETEAAKLLLDFLIGATAAPVLKAKGMEPATK